MTNNETIIWFNIKEAKDYLDQFGEVFTLRDHPKKEGIAKLFSSLSGKPYFKGKVKIIFVKKIDMNSQEDLTNLTPYAKKSGFKDQWEWLVHVPSNQKVLYLFHVRKIITKEIIPDLGLVPI